MLARVHTLISASTCLFTSPMPSLRSANRNSEAVMLPLLSASSALSSDFSSLADLNESRMPAKDVGSFSPLRPNLAWKPSWFFTLPFAPCSSRYAFTSSMS